MIKVPILYVTGLDKKYLNLISYITVSVNAFNTSICSYVNNNCRSSDNTDSDNEQESAKQNSEPSVPQPYNYGQNDDYYDYTQKPLLLADKPYNKYKNTHISGNESKEKDISGNESKEKDIYGNESKEDLSGNEEEEPRININSDENPDDDSVGGPGKAPKKTANLDLYKVPTLIFPTKKKIIKKFYNKLIVRLHPDKREKKHKKAKLFQMYYEECKKSMEMNCLYKLWIISQKMNIKVKITKNIHSAFIKEINILKKYNETLESSFIYKWSNETLPLEKNKYILEYIKTNVTYN